jgi:predicted RNase H-like HicB family nuclease
MKEHRDSSKMSRKIAENLEQPFDKTLLARARQIAAGYRILIEKNERLGYIGSSVEIPTVFADARTPAACYKATEEALTVAVATMLEAGRTPPESAAKRTEQVNIRLTAYEKLVLTAKAAELGFKGISDLIRNTIIRNLLKAS